MRPAKGLHLLIGRPAKLKGDVYAALPILGAVRSMKRESPCGGITDNRHDLFPRLKLCHFVNVRCVHCAACRRSLFVFDSSARVGNEAARSSGKLGSIALAKVID